MTDGSECGEDDGADPPDARAQAMCRMRADGSSLQAIADAFGLTRERVRQIIRDVHGPGRDEARAARRAGDLQRQSDLRTKVLQMSRETPGTTIEVVAQELGTTTAAVRAALGKDSGRVLVVTRKGRSVFSDEALLEHLRKAASIAGEPLTVRGYNEVREDFGGASSALVLQRFGTWRAACTASGVANGRPLRANYERRWTPEQLVEAVAAYLSSQDSRGSFADYERWARLLPAAPSGQTIRSQFGAWSRAKAAALTLLAKTEQLSVPWLRDGSSPGPDGQGSQATPAAQ